MNNRNEHHHTAKQSRRHRLPSPHKPNTASPVSQENNTNDNDDDVVLKSKTSKKSLLPPSDSDGESELTLVEPIAPIPHNFNVALVNPYANQNGNNQNSPSLSLELRQLFEMITEDLDKFVYTPAPNGLGDIQCRITRDRRGVEKGLFPAYYMHIERPGDGKKVCY